MTSEAEKTNDPNRDPNHGPNKETTSQIAEVITDARAVLDSNIDLQAKKEIEDSVTTAIDAFTKLQERVKKAKEAREAPTFQLRGISREALVAQIVAPTTTSQQEVEQYDQLPLPLQTVDANNQQPGLNWTDFDQDETGDYIFLYGGLQNITPNEAQPTSHLSLMAMHGKTESEIYTSYNTDNILDISRNASTRFQESPVLHTTRSELLAKQVAAAATNKEKMGVLVKYKIPKSWLLSQMQNNFVVEGLRQEGEIDAFFGLPQQFVDNIEAVKEINEAENPTTGFTQSDTDSDVFTVTGSTFQPPDPNAAPF